MVADLPNKLEAMKDSNEVPVPPPTIQKNQKSKKDVNGKEAETLDNVTKSSLTT